MYLLHPFIGGMLNYPSIGTLGSLPEFIGIDVMERYWVSLGGMDGIEKYIFYICTCGMECVKF